MQLKIQVDAKTQVDPGKDPVKATDTIRAFIQACLAFKDVPGAEMCQKYNYFAAQIMVTNAFKAIFEELSKAASH